MGAPDAQQQDQLGLVEGPQVSAIVLVLPIPVSSNRYWASRVYKVKGTTNTWRAMTYVTPEAKTYREQVQRIARAAGVLAPIEGRVELGYRLYPHRPLDYKTRMKKFGKAWDDTVQAIDLGNVEKVLSDALQGIVITNDALVRKLVGERMEPDAHGARLMLWVRPQSAAVRQQELIS